MMIGPGFVAAAFAPSVARLALLLVLSYVAVAAGGMLLGYKYGLDHAPAQTCPAPAPAKHKGHR